MRDDQLDELRRDLVLEREQTDPLARLLSKAACSGPAMTTSTGSPADHDVGVDFEAIDRPSASTRHPLDR